MVVWTARDSEQFWQSRVRYKIRCEIVWINRRSNARVGKHLIYRSIAVENRKIERIERAIIVTTDIPSSRYPAKVDPQA